MSDNCGVNKTFLIYTLPHPGGCLVLVMAAVFTRFNWTKTFLTTQSWLFLVLHVTAGSKYIIWLCLSCDISLQDLMAIICRARDCLKKQKRHKLKREKVQGELILPSPTRKKKQKTKAIKSHTHFPFQQWLVGKWMVSRV